MAKNESKELVTRSPKGALSPFEEMERWFEDAFRRPFFGPPWLPRLKFSEFAEVSPAVDIFEEGDDVVLKAEIPGVDKEDLKVDIADDIITISGEKKSVEKVERKDFYRCERSVGSFTRKLRLPTETQTDKAKASFKDGTLEIRIPKTHEAKTKSKKITIE
jgi:HSP20 family protein